MKKFNSNKRPRASVYRFYVPPTPAQAKKGWTVSNSKTYYDVDTFFRRIVLIFQKNNREYDVVRTSQYSDHYGGYFTVSDKQDDEFKRAFKRVKTLAYKKEKMH